MQMRPFDTSPNAFVARDGAARPSPQRRQWSAVGGSSGGTRFLQGLLDLVPDPIVALGSRGVVLGANRAALALISASLSEASGTAITDLIDLASSDAVDLRRAIARPREGESLTGHGVVRATGEAVEFEVDFVSSSDDAEALLPILRLSSAGDLLERFRELTDALEQSPRDVDESTRRRRRLLEDDIAALQRAARVDALTGLDNRASFDSHLARVLAQARRDQRPVSLVLVDIDDFKRVNDEWGHAEGDTVIEAVAAELGPLARRPFDLAARVGGEEFAILLSDCPSSHALDIGVEARTAVKRSSISHPSGTVTISVGVATVSPDQSLDGDELYRAADRALYDAKRRGKDRVCGGR